MEPSATGLRMSFIHFLPFRSFDSGHEHLMAGVMESDNVKRSKFYEAQQTAKELQEIYATAALNRLADE